MLDFWQDHSYTDTYRGVDHRVQFGQARFYYGGLHICIFLLDNFYGRNGKERFFEALLLPETYAIRLRYLHISPRGTHTLEPPEGGVRFMWIALIGVEPGSDALGMGG